MSDLLDLTARVLPCLEILDSRYQGVDVEPIDDIADNCAVARLLLGDGPPWGPPAAELLDVRVRLGPGIDGALPPSRCPTRATLWLANQVIAEAGELEAGSLLVSSACCAPIPLLPGSRVSADFGALGHLQLDTGETP